MRRNSPVKQHVLTSEEKNEQMRRQILYRALSSSLMTSRMSYGGTQSFGGLRDIYTALGYPVLDRISFIDYWTRYRRQDIARRIVEAPVDGAWGLSPVVKADGDSNDIFQGAWEELEEELGIYSTLVRSDILSGIGRYGVLLLGLDDGTQNFLEPSVKAKQLLYLQPFTENNAFIKTFDTDQYSPRYGQPLVYSIRFANLPGMSTGVTASDVPGLNTGIVMDVHYSRIIHLADNILESNIFGVPRMESCFNDLIDLEKVVGGSAEMFWQGAFPGMAFKAQEDFNITPDVKVELEDEIQKYVHQLERHMKLQGIDIQQLSPNISSPKDVAELLITMISVSKNIPKRILEGSERGKLASNQDAEEWDARCDHRRRHYVEPKILRPLIKRLGELGVLKVPAKISIEWPDLATPSDADQATIGNTRTIAITKYAATPEAQLIVPLEQYLADILQLPTEVVDRILAASIDAQNKAMAEEAAAEQQRQDDIAKFGYDPQNINDPLNPQNPKFIGVNNA